MYQTPSPSERWQSMSQELVSTDRIKQLGTDHQGLHPWMPLKTHCTQPLWYLLQLVSPQEGWPILPLWAGPNLAPWARAWPFGVLSQASFPGLPKTELPPHTPIILCYITYNGVIMNPSVILVAKIAWLSVNHTSCVSFIQYKASFSWSLIYKGSPQQKLRIF